MRFTALVENVRLAFDTLQANRFRSFLTVLGIFIGVLLVVTVASVLNGFRQSVVDQMQATRLVRSWDGTARSDQDYNVDGAPDLAGDFDGDGVPDVGGPNVPITTSGTSFGGFLTGATAAGFGDDLSPHLQLAAASSVTSRTRVFTSSPYSTITRSLLPRPYRGHRT